MSLVLHCGGRPATWQDVCDVPVPESTDTYGSVPYEDIISFIREDVISGHLNMKVTNEQYGLAQKGQQLFAKFDLNHGDNEKGLCIAARSSYNMTKSIGLAGGARVFVCDNGAFSGDTFCVMRKHTINVWKDFTTMVMEAAELAFLDYEKLAAELDVLKEFACTDEEGFEMLGRLLGHDVMKPQQITAALSEWREPTHEEFEDRTMWSFYNSCTEGLKRGSAGTAIERHVQVHNWIREEVPEMVQVAA